MTISARQVEVFASILDQEINMAPPYRYDSSDGSNAMAINLREQAGGLRSGWPVCPFSGHARDGLSGLPFNMVSPSPMKWT
jgi:hypothetical protein